MEVREDRLSIDLYIASVLIYHIQKASHDKRIGFFDVNNTADEISANMNRYIVLKQSLVESGLSACNLLNEVGEFTTPKKESFDDFVKRLTRSKYKFNSIYNTLEKRDERKT